MCPGRSVSRVLSDREERVSHLRGLCCPVWQRVTKRGSRSGGPRTHIPLEGTGELLPSSAAPGPGVGTGPSPNSSVLDGPRPRAAGCRAAQTRWSQRLLGHGGGALGRDTLFTVAKTRVPTRTRGNHGNHLGLALRGASPWVTLTVESPDPRCLKPASLGTFAPSLRYRSPCALPPGSRVGRRGSPRRCRSAGTAASCGRAPSPETGGAAAARGPQPSAPAVPALRARPHPSQGVTASVHTLPPRARARRPPRPSPGRTSTGSLPCPQHWPCSPPDPARGGRRCYGLGHVGKLRHAGEGPCWLGAGRTAPRPCSCVLRPRLAVQHAPCRC